MSETTVTIPNELEICVERVFDAPRAHVFSDVPEPPADARVAQSMMNFGEQRRGIRELTLRIERSRRWPKCTSR
jgi:hypothetical protein